VRYLPVLIALILLVMFMATMGNRSGGESVRQGKDLLLAIAVVIGVSAVLGLIVVARS